MSKLKVFTKLKKLRIGNYLRELSTIIIGVTLTLMANSMVSSIKEKRDIKLQLKAIYSEMEDNLTRINNLSYHYNGLENLRKYLLESLRNPQPHTADSIKKYESAAWGTVPFNYKKGAYTMFINSGAMKSFTNRELLLKITEAYSALEELKAEHYEFVDAKKLMFSETYKKNRKDIMDLDIMVPKNDIMFNFHALNSGMEVQVRHVREEIEDLLSFNKE